jgi:hypothetical protein
LFSLQVKNHLMLSQRPPRPPSILPWTMSIYTNLPSHSHFFFFILSLSLLPIFSTTHHTYAPHTRLQIHSTSHHITTHINQPTNQPTTMRFAPTSYAQTTPAMMTSSTTRRAGAGRPRNMTNDIITLVDEHLAWQVQVEEREQQRRGSVGTLIVDWDGTGEGYAFHRGSESGSSSSRRSEAARTERQRTHYAAPTRASAARARGPATGSGASTHHHASSRRREESRPSRQRCDSTTVNYHRDTTKPTTRIIHTPNTSSRSSTPTPTHSHTDISITYTPTTNTAHGFDPSSSFAYQYNGSNLRVHHDTSPTTHDFHVPVERYLASKQLPALPSSSSEWKKRGVMGFVKKVLGKLEKVGVLGKMKARWEREGRMVVQRESWAA